TTVTYSFTTVANLSGFGTYTIEAVVDYAGDSFRDNDTSRITIVNVPTITSFPSIETFEGNSGYWYAAGRNSSWEWGMPSSKLIKSAASGAKAWKTHLVGNYNDNEASYLYSPCYNISGLTVPTLSFSVALDFEDCGTTLCDGAWVEYSSDGISWTKLGAAGTGYNWYNKTTDRLWSIQSYTRWHVATIPLPIGLSQLRLRFALASDAGVNREGMAIDDIHIYDNTKGLYEGPTLTAPIIQTVSGSGWVDFTSGGKLLASLQPSNQNLGATAIRGFIDTTVSRWNNAQYYHGRNLTIKPANRELADSVAVRFYFTDRETEKLLTATGCTNCGKPTSAYELGVSQYSDPDTSFENGSVLDDQQGVWRFIKTGDRTLVPFDKGYYAEFKVKSFSEFWLNNGGLDKGTPLPIKLMEFSAQRSGVDALLRWSVGSETEVARYEIEVARGIADLNAARFSKIGEVVSGGNTTVSRLYSFTDTEADKFGTRYYRLKAINNDGSFRYSAIRPVTFADAVLWNVYPNPSAGIFFLVYETAVSEKLSLQVFNAQGALVMQEEKAGTGYPQKLVLNLKNKVFAAGMYLLKVKAGDQEQAFKLNKQ
ncbi:MAG: family serine peptidase, partial [Flaviaesturariibacter sp.]|nr:family serine peptidase [Flaviaesturariibacter sp.]